jgi:SAM-dependent methyltransferase
VAILLRVTRAVANRLRYRLHRLVSGRRGCRSYAEFMRTAFDRRFGIDTAHSLETMQFQGEGPNSGFGNWYMPTEMAMFRLMIKSLTIDPREFVFVDLGSGKGRMLVAAAEAGFRRVVGVEYSADLHAVAQRNVRSYLQRRRRRVEIQTLHADAADYEIPDEPLVILFFNSFLEPVLSVVLGNLRRALDRRPRDVYILHNGPQFYPGITALFEQTPWLETASSAGGYAVYRAVSLRGAASGEDRPVVSNDRL